MTKTAAAGGHPGAFLECVLANRMTEDLAHLLRILEESLTAERLAGWRTTAEGPVGREAWRELGRLGALGLSVPAEHGGRGLGLEGSLGLTSLLAARDEGGLVLGANVQSEVACQWLLHGSAAIRDVYLPQVLAGDLVACQCDTDPAAAEPTRAQLDGDDVVVEGRKLYVINGAVADLCFVAARLGNSPAIILVEKSRPGVSVETVWDKLGTRSVDSATVRFDRVRVPASHLLSQHGLGQMLLWNQVMSRLRFLIAAAAATMHRELLDHVERHGVARELGGRSLIGWPVNHHAWTRARTDQALMAAGIATCLDRMAKPVNAVPEVAQLKWFCVERACALASRACDLDGGLGYMAQSRPLAVYRVMRGFRMSGGSQTTMLTIANHSLASRAENEPYWAAARADLVAGAA